MSTSQTTPELMENSSAAMLSDPRRWGPMLELSCDLSIDLPVPKFTVADLLRLESGTVIETQWALGEDVPVRVNGQLIAWAEFELVGESLAVRITEWA